MTTRFIILYSTIFLGLLASACKVGRNYHRPEVSLPAAFGTVTADTSSIADIKWNRYFTDTTLQGLITKSLAYNYDLQLAVKRIDISQQQLKQARLLILPQLDLQVTAQYTRPSDNSLSGLSTSTFLGKSYIENYSAAMGVSWEIDVWGKIRRQKESALAQYLQTREATRAVQTQLIADIAQGYFNLLMLDKQLVIAQRNLSLSDSTIKITQLLKNAGEVNQLAVQQAEAQRQTTGVLIPQLEQSIIMQETALQQLTGQLPSHIKRDRSLDSQVLLSDLKYGLPSAILSRRPDIRAKEMALLAANADAGVAQGNLYPSLRLTAAGGLESFKSSNWFNVPGSLFGLAAGTVLQPVFRSRLLKTQYEVAKIRREQAVLEFRQSVLNAVAEVTNSLSETEKLQTQHDAAVIQVNILNKAIKNAQLLFRSDMANYLEVLTAQSSALQAELNLAAIQRRQLSAMVELYRSLGGGWQ